MDETTTLWARWDRGRWHAVAGAASIVVNGTQMRAFVTACGRARIPPTETAASAGRPVCPTCETLDSLRSRYPTEFVPAPVAEPVPVPVARKAALQ